MSIEPSVQVALLTICGGLIMHVINNIQKTVERFLGQKHFQKHAIVILRELDKEVDEVKSSVKELKGCMESQRSIMKQLLMYTKQHYDAAKQMSKLMDDFIKNSKENNDNGRSNE